MLNPTVPYCIYADLEKLEPTALDQFASALAEPSVLQAALMPDAHTGYTLPIGAVVATDNMVFPSWVGYDIGCGMCALPMSTTTLALQGAAQGIFKQIYRDIPMGFNHNQNFDPEGIPDDLMVTCRTSVIQDQLDNNAWKQLGSLGSGNHFIEIGSDETGQVWIICHSGSRNVGHRTASHYMGLASPDGKPSEGHFGFAADSQNGGDYITDLRFALEFALANRKLIVARVAEAIHTYAGGEPDWSRLINRNHNHAELDAQGRWVHRKGATHAEAGMLGVIPGNMRDGSFIVRGKGNPNSLCSSSHGAGRVLGRKKAQQTLSLEAFAATMEGITAKVGASTLDESPEAYKSIFDVMAAQTDLVEVLHHVRPIINIKA